MKIRKVLDPKLKWGIAGCGNFTEQKVIPTIKMLKSSKTVSIYSKSLERAKNFSLKYSIKEYHDNFDKFLEGDFNCVYVASSNIDHHWQVIAAAKAKKHIVCEKPLALNSTQAEEMVKVCEENNVVFMVGYLQRYHPLCIKAKEIIDSGMIGKLVLINSSQSFNYPPSENYRLRKELSGGGALRDVGTHSIDLLRFFGGEIKKAKGFVGNIIYQYEVDDFASANFQFENGFYGNIYASYCISKPLNRIEIIGYKGTIVIEGVIGRTFINYPKMSISIDGQVKKAFRKSGNSFLNLLKDFKQSVLKNTKPQITGTDGLINLKLMEEIERNCC